MRTLVVSFFLIVHVNAFALPELNYLSIFVKGKQVGWLAQSRVQRPGSSNLFFRVWLSLPGAGISRKSESETDNALNPKRFVAIESGPQESITIIGKCEVTCEFSYKTPTSEKKSYVTFGSHLLLENSEIFRLKNWLRSKTVNPLFSAQIFTEVTGELDGRTYERLDTKNLDRIIVSRRILRDGITLVEQLHFDRRLNLVRVIGDQMSFEGVRRRSLAEAVGAFGAQNTREVIRFLTDPSANISAQ